MKTNTSITSERFSLEDIVGNGPTALDAETLKTLFFSKSPFDERCDALAEQVIALRAAKESERFNLEDIVGNGPSPLDAETLKTLFFSKSPFDERCEALAEQVIALRAARKAAEKSE